MKTKIFTLLFAVAANVGAIFAWDYEHVQIGDLYYNLDATDQTAEVTYELAWDWENNYFGLTTATIPVSVEYNSSIYSVTSIGEAAFYWCPSLTSVTIPNSVTNIGNSAFPACVGLTSVTIGNSVTSIGNSAFSYCTSLASIEIPNSVTIIGDRAFYGCSGLTSVTIGNSVTSIGDRAFYGCSGLTSIIWNAKNCQDFSSYSTPFYNLRNQIISFVFGEEVEHIPAYLCMEMTNLTSIEIPNSVTSIGNRVFEGCTGLTSIDVLCKTPPTLGSQVFYDCNNLTSLYVPCGTLDAYKQSWSTYKNKIKYRPLKYTITGNVNLSTAGNVTIPQTLCDTIISATPNYGYHFTQWSDSVTDNPRTIELTQDTTFTAEFALDRSGKCGNDLALTWEYDAENQVLTISGEGAFNEHMECGVEAKSAMKNLVIENGVTSIGNSAFSGCSGLTSVTIGNSVTSIGNKVFEGCTGLTSVTIGNSVTGITNDAFQGCSGLTSIIWNAKNCQDFSSYSTPFYNLRNQIISFVFGEKVEHIPAYLCEGMTNLTSIEIPNSVTSIGRSAFTGCSSLTSIEIPNSVTDIREYVFSGCSGLTNIEIPTGVTWIGDAAFANCTGLTSVEIPNAVESLGRIAFSECRGLQSVVMGNKLKIIQEYTFAYCTRLEKVVFGDSVKQIGPSAFVGCPSIRDLVLPNSLDSVKDLAFATCTGIQNVTIPQSVVYLGGAVFCGCSGIRTITNYALTPQDCDYSLGPFTSWLNCGTDLDKNFATLYVPAESVEVYKAAEFWKYFKNIVPIGATDVDVQNNKVTIKAGDNDAIFTWPTTNGAASYTIQITKNGELVCTLIFNANGQLTGIAFAPARDSSHHAPAATLTTNGMQFTVTGLSYATNYGYSLIAKDSYNNVLASYSGYFGTTGAPDAPEGIGDVLSHKPTNNSYKILRDGQLLILRGDKVYTLQGQEVR